MTQSIEALVEAPAREYAFKHGGHTFPIHPWLEEEIGFRCPCFYEFEQVVGTLKGVMLRIEKAFFPNTRYKDAYGTFVRRMRGPKNAPQRLYRELYNPAAGLTFAEWFLLEWTKFLAKAQPKIKTVKIKPVPTNEVPVDGLFAVFGEKA